MLLCKYYAFITKAILNGYSVSGISSWLASQLTYVLVSRICMSHSQTQLCLISCQEIYKTHTQGIDYIVKRNKSLRIPGEQRQ